MEDFYKKILNEIKIDKLFSIYPSIFEIALRLEAPILKKGVKIKISEQEMIAFDNFENIENHFEFNGTILKYNLDKTKIKDFESTIKGVYSLFRNIRSSFYNKIKSFSIEKLNNDFIKIKATEFEDRVLTSNPPMSYQAFITTDVGNITLHLPEANESGINKLLKFFNINYEFDHNIYHKKHPHSIVCEIKEKISDIIGRDLHFFGLSQVQKESTYAFWAGICTTQEEINNHEELRIREIERKLHKLSFRFLKKSDRYKNIVFYE